VYFETPRPDTKKPNVIPRKSSHGNVPFGPRGLLRRKRVQVGARKSASTFAASNIINGTFLNLGTMPMTRLVVLIASVAINTMSIPAVASECDSMTELASRARWAGISRQPIRSTDTVEICRAYAASFYRIVLTRQAAAACGVGRQSDLAALDSEINAFNDLLATKCGG
jgi:hypothetical protein